jgi:hypothetical protein
MHAMTNDESQDKRQTYTNGCRHWGIGDGEGHDGWNQEERQSVHEVKCCEKGTNLMKLFWKPEPLKQCGVDP